MGGTDGERFGPERITQVEAADLHTATLRMQWAKFFLTYDFLVLPASPMPALTKPEFTLENRGRILALTAPASIGGLPVLTVPVPLPSGLTTGLQIIVNNPISPVVNWALQRCMEQGDAVWISPHFSH
jgi:amidase/aspartyl-tRNA(Asn)/glutamyl-tRNA(Gln) amidotransferase subunit A